jgi:CRISPR/Cas system CSM-associated protein Csm3 (group 7 of RAMP superfamily)
MQDSIRYLARITIEAKTPLAIGSGERGFTIDRLIARDASGLPYIPGTSLTGVLRKAFEQQVGEEDAKALFGYQTPNKRSEGAGSRLMLSSAHLLAEDGKTVMEGLPTYSRQSPYFAAFFRLPERDHVRITHRGGADTEGRGKYDEELVPKGARFVFAMELAGDVDRKENWEQLLALLHQPLLRLGAGTRKGLGRLQVVECLTATFDLEQEADLMAYLQLPNSLNALLKGGTPYQKNDKSNGLPSGWLHYQLEVTPQSFLLFGAGFGDEDADLVPKTESYFSWENGKAQLKKGDFLIPATSLKGALSHRVAFHYNRLSGTCIAPEESQATPPDLPVAEVLNSYALPALPDPELSADDPAWKELSQQVDGIGLDDLLKAAPAWDNFVDQLDRYEQEEEEANMPVGENNEAVRALFGFAKEGEAGQRGRVIFSDLYLDKKEVSEKVFNHVMIDRFTGGAKDGALFQQKLITTDQSLRWDLWVEQAAFEDDRVQQAWEASLQDLCEGRLPLGGSTTKGHGALQGTFTHHSNPKQD